MRTFSRTIALLYLVLPALFIGLNLRSPSSHDQLQVQWPSFQLAAGPATAAGIRRLDLSLLKHTVNRLPSVTLMRQTGNSLRLTLGQTLSWCIWGKDSPPMLFATVELWASEGLTPANELLVDRSAAMIQRLHQQLSREGWTLVIVPVPTKLSIHRDRCAWPVMEQDLMTRQPVIRDRADEIYDRLLHDLHAGGIPAVDLKTLYRRHLLAHPDDLLYPLGETHWSGLGLTIAANATAELVSKETGIPRRQFTPSYFPVEETADIAAAFDPLPGWTSRLGAAYRYRDRLIDGEQGVGFHYASKPTALLIATGTSYSGQFTWHIGHPVGFAWAVGGQLDKCEFHSMAQAGHGSYASFARFLTDRAELARTFSQQRALTNFPKVVVWEFPVRDLADIERNASR